MKMKLWLGAAFVVGVLVGHARIPIAYAQLRTVKTDRLLTVDLAGWCDGKEVTVELNQANPGTSGKHFHPAHSFTYVLEGSETYTLEGQGSNTVKVGDVLHEAPTQLHTVENLSPVKLLVVRVIEKGKEPTVRLQ